jgi:hypothetical protein
VIKLVILEAYHNFISAPTIKITNVKSFAIVKFGIFAFFIVVLGGKLLKAASIPV